MGQVNATELLENHGPSRTAASEVAWLNNQRLNVKLPASLGVVFALIIRLISLESSASNEK